jgi:DNA-binding IscR family transcriptional regulator
MTELPPGAIGPWATSIILAMVTRPPQRWTVRDVAAAVGHTPSHTLEHLRLLRTHGLVEWTEGRKATLRATARVVPR